MDHAQVIHKRKSKYMAQILETFEEVIEKHLPEDAAGDVQDFKGLVRARVNALAVDACDLITLMRVGEEQNELAREIKERLHV